MRRFASAVLLALAAFCWGASPAHAHADLASTEPAPGAVLSVLPESFSLTFAKDVDAVFMSMELVAGTPDAPGAVLASLTRETDAYAKDVRFHLPESYTPTPLEGSFHLHWRYFGLDGHTMEGTVPFSIGTSPTPSTVPTSVPTTDPTNAPPTLTTASKPYVPVLFQALRAAARGLVFLSAMVLFGAWFWSSRRTLLAFDKLSAPIWRSWQRFAGTALSASCALVAVFSVLAARDVGVRSLHATGVLVSSQAVFPWLVAAFTAPASSRRRSFVLPSVVVVSIAAALSSHAADTPLPAFSMFFAFVHVAALIAWTGPLLALGILRAPASGFRSHPRLGLIMAQALREYSNLAFFSMCALVVSGARQAFVIPGGLPAGDWGRYLVVKLVLFAVCVAPLGLFHHLALKRHASGDGSVPEMRRTVLLEAFGVVLTLTVAVVLAATH